uniref:Transmembrane protein 268 n=1 Tax=Pectinophora gossypiella TaxID=13191 RepID=A0A1E1VXN8_PECGO
MSSTDVANSSAKKSETNGNIHQDKLPKDWVKFDDESPQTSDPLSDPKVSSEIPVSTTASTSHTTSSEPAAVLKTETVHVNLERGDRNTEPVTQATLSKNVEFVNVRQGFSNGDIIVTLLPVNSKWPWITAARFRPELVPEELMAQGLTLTVEEYVHAMELLVNDARFTLYNICYKRVLVCWITLAFLVLLALLFSGLTGLTLFSLGVLWLVLNAAAIFLCMWIKLKLSKGLEQCLGSVNKLLNKHKLILALDDRGKISCHKVNLCFIYFDSGPCIAHIQQFIESEEGKTIMEGWEQRLDVPANDIVIQGSQSTRLSRRQGMAEPVYLRYLQRWGKDFLRRRLDWTLDEDGGNPAAPRHLTHALCPCQYVEEILRNKEPRDTRACCPSCNDWLRRRGLD